MRPAFPVTTKAGTAILAQTYLAPDQEYHLRELVRRTGMAPRTIQVEVDRLVAAGLLAERRDGNRRYLRAQQGHPLFAPLRDIIVKTAGVAPLLATALQDDDVQLAFVFGSIAAGTAGAGSDVDLLVIGTAKSRAIVRRLAEVQKTLGREITPIVWTAAEFRERRQRGDPFLARVLAGPRLMIVGSDHDLDELGGERLALINDSEH